MPLEDLFQPHPLEQPVQKRHGANLKRLQLESLAAGLLAGFDGAPGTV
jgi:hypothetical protein